MKIRFKIPKINYSKAKKILFWILIIDLVVLFITSSSGIAENVALTTASLFFVILPLWIFCANKSREINNTKNFENYNFKRPKKDSAKLMKTIVIINFIGFLIFSSYGLYYLYQKYFAKEKNIQFCSFGINDASRSVVRIYGDYGSGSGFWVTPELILTNNHVVFENPRKIKINGYEYEAKIVATDTVRDLALLKLVGTDNYKGTPLNFRKKPLQLAEDVYALGYPAELETQTVSKGIVSSITPDPYDDRVYVQTDTAINPGNSGGPLLDKCGNVVGINTSSLLRDQNISFAIKYDQAQRVIDEMISRKNVPVVIGKDNYPATAEEVVATYYNTLNYGIFEKAYDNYFSTRRKKDLPRENWIKGISISYGIRLKSSEKTDQENVVKARFIATEFLDGQITDNEFEGTWTLTKENGQWKMDESNIKKLENPKS